MRLSLKRIFGVLSVIALILLLGGVVVAVILYTLPFGPVIDLVTRNQAESTKPSVTQAVARPRPTCGSTEVKHILVIGRASLNEAGMYGADAVRLVILNFDIPSAVVSALPAELWVDSPVLADQGIEQTELNLV